MGKEEKGTGLLLIGPKSSSGESKFCISFGSQSPGVWKESGKPQNPMCLKSRVKFLQAVMSWHAMSSAAVGGG